MNSSKCHLPLLASSDALVIGGSCAGVSTALALARRGLSVMLVESRTYLGREVTATLRYWLTPGEFPLVGWLDEIVTELGLVFTPNQTGAEIPLHPDHFKTRLEDLLLAAGVRLLYASRPVQVLLDEAGIRGVVVGNKSGRQVLLARLVVDATETALCARLIGASFKPTPERDIYHSAIELTGAHDFPEESVQAPKALGLVNNELRIHRTAWGGSHRYVEFALELEAEADWQASMRRDLRTRLVQLEVAEFLLTTLSRFYWGNWAGNSLELHGPHTPPLESDIPPWASFLEKETVSISKIGGDKLQLPATNFAGPLSGLWILSPAARNGSGNFFFNPVSAALIGEAVGQSLPPVEPEIISNAVINGLSGPQRGRAYIPVSVPEQEIFLLRHTEVLVVGGGTSGATAAVASAQAGAQSILVEMNPGLGGTGTLGGVVTYWMGQRRGFVPQIEQAVDRIHRRINYQPNLPWEVWNRQAKMQALLEEAQRAGVEVFWNAVCCDVLMDGNQVRGAVFASPYGPFAIGGAVVIDSTGDGDLAAFAGAEWIYGDESEAAAMWTAFPNVPAPGAGNAGNFTSAVEVSNVVDLTRGILAGRRCNHRRNQNHYQTTEKQSPQEMLYDHGVYMAPRESRHVRGDVVLSLTDQLRGRKWPDVVTVCYSNYDVKGKSVTDWNRMGLLPPNLEIEIPYRALLPHGIEGLLVAGKAFSALSQAVPSIRMQPDLENLGGAVGVAAALATRQGRTPRQLDVTILQSRLMTLGLLNEAVLTRQLTAHEYTEAELKTLAGQIQAEPALWEYNNMPLQAVFNEKIPLVEVVSANERAIPILQLEMENSHGPRRVVLAQALALLGSPFGVPVLLEQIKDMLASEKLPPRQAYMFNANLTPPDQGAMPELCYLLYSLGMTRDRRSLEVWEAIADLLEFNEADLWDAYQGPLLYVETVAFGAERLGDAEAIPALQKMHAQPLLHGQVRWSGIEVNFMQERQARTEIALARSLARCGSREGYEILINYLSDNRALLAEAARLALVDISEEGFGLDTTAWKTWLAGKELHPTPLLKPANIGVDQSQPFYQ